MEFSAASPGQLFADGLLLRQAYTSLNGYFDCLVQSLIFHRRDRTNVYPIAFIESVYVLYKFMHFYMRNVFVSNCCKQVQNIVEQLAAGIRYFDLRIAHKQYDSSNELYFTHVIYTHAMVIVSIDEC